ncbi:MAG: DUF4249 domain-containing protein [Bacteroides sp.]|nr:DUF4249 domain-containing protein [Bacteroides sp.]
MKKICWGIAVLVLFFLGEGCEEKMEGNAAPVLVVEGWIDSDGYPVVLVTTSASLSEEYLPIDELEANIVKWARVTVSDGESEAVLTGKVGKGYFPPYIYTTTRMMGVPGKTYRLTVEYKDYYATALTRIPQPVPVDSFRLEQCAGSDSLYQLTACFTDNRAENNYYKFFMRQWGRDDVWLSCFLGTVSDEVTGEQVEVPVYQPQRLFEKDYTPYFLKNDTLVVKFSQLDSLGYHYWDAYEKLTSFSGNLLFPVATNLPSNIDGGIGYWLGYGSSVYHLALENLLLDGE